MKRYWKTAITGVSLCVFMLILSGCDSDAAPLYITIDERVICTQETELDLSGRGLASRDIVSLRYMRNLEELYLSGNNQIRNLTPLSNLTNLRVLILSGNLPDPGHLSAYDGNQIRNITPLSNLTNLEVLRIGNNQIRNITPLTRACSHYHPPTNYAIIPT